MQIGVDPAEWRGLLDRANAGELSLSLDVGKGLDQVCDSYIARLQSILDGMDLITEITGFGTFPSSSALQSKFRLKATGTDQSLDTVIQQHIDTVKLAKQVVAKAIANFSETGQQTAEQITSAGTPR
ncbi:hypothetical protein [Nocardia sp. NPDC052566]|uniref:hypothetical protein n=1 Tax=Nocardia sp. NPDC052566 TaxID=3364330 RepID=UPI0037C5A039